MSTKSRLLLLYIITPILIFPFMSGCSPDNAGWTFHKEIKLKNIHPSGIAVYMGRIWITDSTSDIVALYDTTGKQLKEFKDFDRPVHPAIFEDRLLVPEFSNGNVKLIDQKGNVKLFNLITSPGHASGAGAEAAKFCLADYGRNRIIVQQGDRAYSFGKKGSAHGELDHPTDVALRDGLLYAADAGNKRIQVFDLAGKSIKMIGEAEKISHLSSVFVDNNFVFAAAFNKGNVFIYNIDGKLEQVLSDNIEKPTGLYSTDKYLYVSNYANSTVVIFEKK